MNVHLVPQVNHLNYKYREIEKINSKECLKPLVQTKTIELALNKRLKLKIN